jgi:outer membrane biosynthesis protein TonB
MTDLIPPGIDQSGATAGPGRLKLRLLIDELGKVTSIEVLASWPPGFLEDSALPYIREILFAPARLNSMAVKSEKIIEIAYSPDANP